MKNACVLHKYIDYDEYEKMKLYEMFGHVITEDYKTSAAKQLQSNQELQQACDLINAGGQLSWTLTPAKLNQKLGSEGAIFGLFDDDEIIGTIGLKHSNIQSHSVAEVGYLYVIPEHRNFQNLMKLYNIASEYAPSYDFVYATTIKTNQTINTILQRNSRVKFAFSARSPFSSNILNYWISKNSRLDSDEAIEILKSEFGGSRLTESSVNEFKIVLSRVELAPKNFQPSIQRLISSSKFIETGDNAGPNQVLVIFGRQSSLPTKKNTIYVGNKYYNKEQQYNILKNVVPLPFTTTNPNELKGEFVAKQKTGHKQKGQLINQLPDNPEDYIFQKKIELKSEYRVVVFYMNGKYHVSGVYKKTGSNLSFISITSGQIHDKCIDIAISACENLGYGTSGVDLAITTSELGEGVGGIASSLGKLAGKFQGKSINGQVVFLEANTLPSMANPMLLNDFLKHIKLKME